MRKAMSIREYRRGGSIGRERRKRSAWSAPKLMAGGLVRLQAKAGHRAALVELKPGLYIVALLNANATIGANPQDVAQEIVRTVGKGLDAIFPRRAQPAAPTRQLAAPAAAPQLPAPAQPSALPKGAAPWLDDDADVGCRGACRCGG